MSLLSTLRGNGHGTTAVAEKPGCLHTALAPRWDQLDDIGHEDWQAACNGTGTGRPLVRHRCASQDLGVLPNGSIAMVQGDRDETEDVSRQAIEKRAYELYEARGEQGHDVEDWLQAEAELRSHPISTASEEAAVRGAEAAAAEEKRQAEVGATLDAGARALMTDVGPSIAPRRDDAERMSKS
jgi:hypothetical protein